MFGRGKERQGDSPVIVGNPLEGDARTQGIIVDFRERMYTTPPEIDGMRAALLEVQTGALSAGIKPRDAFVGVSGLAGELENRVRALGRTDIADGLGEIRQGFNIAIEALTPKPAPVAPVAPVRPQTYSKS